MMDSSGGAETFWERYLAQYRFRRLWGESQWEAFRHAIKAAWKNESATNRP
jgi:hypothetical protein